MEAHSAPAVSSLIYPLINFAILVGALFYFLRKPVKSFVLERHTNLKDQLDQVQTKLVQAQRQYNEYSQRLSSMDAEVASLVQNIRSEAETTRVRTATEAKRMADQIVIDAKRAGESMVSEFRDQIRTDLANQVIARAEVLLKTRMTGDVREQLRKDFSKQVENVR
jgi:F-type H+-transporting ATPase subunit b